MSAIASPPFRRRREAKIAIHEGAAVKLDHQRIGRADRPALVISQIRSNRRNDQIVMNKASSMTVGRIVGHITARNTWMRPAPS